MTLECCNCGKWYDPDKVPEVQIGFCSNKCLQAYLKKIDAWFEDLKAKLRARSSIG